MPLHPSRLAGADPLSNVIDLRTHADCLQGEWVERLLETPDVSIGWRSSIPPHIKGWAAVVSSLDTIAPTVAHHL